MNISKHFINRPVATTLLTIGLALAGIIAFNLLPVSSLPRIDFPTILVTAKLPGGDPETMATAVAAPLERKLGHIAGVTEMTSTSNRGFTYIVVQFDLDRDIDGAARDVQGAINAALGDLTTDLEGNPTYRKVNPSEAPILILSLTSDTLDRPKMYDAASTILQQKLSQMEGVGNVYIGGGSLPATRVEMNPMAVNKYGINLREMRGILAGSNVNRPKGQLMNDEQTWEIQTNDQLRRAWDYRNVIVSYRSGAAVKLMDVATVQESVEDMRTYGIVNGEPAVSVLIYRQPDANIIDTVDRIREMLPQLTAALPGGIKLSILQDRTPSIRGSLREVETALVIAILLVILVVFLFLRDFRSTLIPGVAVTVSIVGTFAVMHLAGFSLNNLSLMALTISTGFVVDDAIVVLENITRYMEKGATALEAALQGSREIAFTVISMSLSLIAVFIPILLMKGIVGRLFREFAITLSVAILISLVLSLTTTPMMCAALLKSKTSSAGPHKKRRLYEAAGRVFDRIHHAYDVSLCWALNRPRTMLTLTLSMVVLSIALFIVIPKGFFPVQDTGRIAGVIHGDQSSSFQTMRRKLTVITEIVRKDPDVTSVSAYTGGGTGTNQGRMNISLKPPESRTSSIQDVIARLRRKLYMVPGAPSYLQPVQDIRIGGRSSGALYQYTLQGENLPELNEWAAKLRRHMGGMKELADVNSDLQEKGLQVSVAVDRDAAARFGIRPAAIDEVLYDAFGQRQISVNYTLLNQYRVVMEVEPRFWQYPETLQYIYVTPAGGDPVPLAAFARFQQSTTSLTVNHQSQFPSVTISFNLAQGINLGEAVTAVEAAMREMKMPPAIRGSFQGTAKAFKESLANQPLLILAALIAVYIVLGILYESTIHPITILSTLPSAGVGALLALLIFGDELSVIAIIGIILLIGLVKKNGIMMVDFALEAQRKEGKSPMDAIYQACLLRFRPIMMTTLAAMLGALPLALGTGVGSEIRRPLGIAIIGGLIVSQMLTLFTTPVIYLYLDRVRLRLEKRRLRLKMPKPLLLTAAVMVMALLGLSACSVGPDYVKPQTQVPAAYKEMKGWKLASPQDGIARGKWWKMFGDPVLDELTAQVNVSNQTIILAEAQYRQAAAQVRLARANYFPTVGADAAYQRSRGPSTGNEISNVHQLSLGASWELDIWGKVRRQVEAGTAIAQASSADLEAMRLSMQTELVLNYYQLRMIDEQKKNLDNAVAAYAKVLMLTENRYQAGVVAKADVVQARTQLKSTEAQAIDLGIYRAQLEHAIAILIGKPPADFTLPTAEFRWPEILIPVGIPSELLERRPDIASAERRMAAANAQIGVAKAAYYPSLTLSGSLGYQGAELANLFTSPHFFWAIGPMVAAATLFDGGARRAKTDQARAAYDSAVAYYRQTVLAAFQDVEDNLAALRILKEEAEVQDQAVGSARESVRLTTNQYKAGTVSYLSVAVVQTAALANERTAISISAQRLRAAALLVKALGGGWSTDIQTDAKAKVAQAAPGDQKK